MAGLDFSAIRVPNSGSSGSLSTSLQGGNSGALQSPISIGMNDDPAMVNAAAKLFKKYKIFIIIYLYLTLQVREAFFKNPDQMALVSFLKG